MTNKEAIRNLENWKLFDKKIIEIDGDLGESIRLAIKALEENDNNKIDKLIITLNNRDILDNVDRDFIYNDIDIVEWAKRKQEAAND